ncbi:hypothetical protein N0V90_011666 [Kalmusia sp. IMI 367209]|nr:hypothetical protein N0V90_011666 [Kalmusia sp. IMI 367209]
MWTHGHYIDQLALHHQSKVALRIELQALSNHSSAATSQRLGREYLRAGYAPDPDPAVNAEKWVICSIRELSKSGLRVTQGISGSFLLSRENDYVQINFIPSVVSNAYGRWNFRGRQRERSRSRSPERQAWTNRAGSRGGKGEYRDRSPFGMARNTELNELAERLGDAKVGLREDKDVDGLLEWVAKI